MSGAALFALLLLAGFEGLGGGARLAPVSLQQAGAPPPVQRIEASSHMVPRAGGAAGGLGARRGVYADPAPPWAALP